MTKFTNENILKDGNSIYYAPDGWETPWSERMFIARFKYPTSPFTMGKFKTQLKKRFTVEAYAAKRDNGRAFYFGRVAKRIYACLDAGEEYSLRDFMLSNKYDSSAMTELLEYYCAAYEARATPRMVVIAKHDPSYVNVAHLPTWRF